MKIGILTFHRALNYGALLQCYALYKTLASLGHDVEIIDYRPAAIEKYRRIFYTKDFKGKNGLKAKIRYIVSSLILIHSKKKTSRKFDEFLNSNFKFSKLVKKSQDIPDYYDAIIFGSDQIWNPNICEGLDEIYYGQFKKGRTKFISYAASVGRLDLLKANFYVSFKKYISNFDSLAVRETNLFDFITKDLKIFANRVCDPSLFMTNEMCRSIARFPMDNNYILVYDLERNPKTEKFVKKLQKQLNTNVIMMMAETNHLHKFPFEIRSEISPSEFLGYILNAKCVVTNSFHVTSFSLILQKDFYTTIRNDNNNRSATILKVAGLEDRQVPLDADMKFTHVNYSQVKDRLDAYKLQSMQYLYKALSLI